MEKERPLYQLLAASVCARNYCELYENKEWFGRHTYKVSHYMVSLDNCSHFWLTGMLPAYLNLKR